MVQNQFRLLLALNHLAMIQLRLLMVYMDCEKHITPQVVERQVLLQKE
jgi:hypothetical protein